MMNRAASQGTLQGWRELYCAALFEQDTNQIPARIVDAEKAIVARARELLHGWHRYR